MGRLRDMLGSQYPIIQGPIGAINSPRFTAAICEAGAFGMLAMGFVYDLEEAKRMVSEVRELTDKPFGVNLMIANPTNPQILEVLADAGVKLVTTSAGSPRDLLSAVHGFGMKGMHVLLALPHAVKAVEAGADGVVIAGNEAGGLRSVNPESSTLVLVPLVCDHVDVPVVAAGGIADSRGYRAALALGAEGVQLGTRLIASEECPAPQAWKEAIVACGDGGTTLVPLGKMSMRSIVNPKLQGEINDPDVELSEIYSLMDAPVAWNSGEFEKFPAGAGQVAALINEIKPVKDIIAEMVRE